MSPLPTNIKAKESQILRGFYGCERKHSDARTPEPRRGLELDVCKKKIKEFFENWADEFSLGGQGREELGESTTEFCIVLNRRLRL